MYEVLPRATAKGTFIPGGAHACVRVAPLIKVQKWMNGELSRTTWAQ